MANNPVGYKKWIERVSNIVSFVFPFEGNSKERYIKWLWLHWVPEDEYLDEAKLVWTFVHKQMETWGGGRNSALYELHKEEIEYWLSFIRKLSKYWELHHEQYIRDYKNRYQWTADLVVINEKKKKVYIYDYKTWGIAKKKWNILYYIFGVLMLRIPIFLMKNTYKKPYDKIKKVALQLSLYGEYYRQLGYSLELISVLWLHETGCYEYKLPIYTTNEINSILEKYEKTKI